MKSIEFYINEVKSNSLDGGIHRTKVYPFIDDGVILVNKREKEFSVLKDNIKKCKDLGVNIPEYFNYCEVDGEFWILEELAPGKEFAELVNCDDGLSFLDSIPYEHIEKYINDVYLLGKNGLGVEPRRRNIFYDADSGFTTIDVALSSKTIKNDSLKDVNYFFSMFFPVFMIDFGDKEYGKLVRNKIVLNLMKAFENGHPEFSKYQRWIYRNSQTFSKVLTYNGYDLSLTVSEREELYQYIEELIQVVIQRVLMHEQMFTSLFGYMELLTASIKKCFDFDLFDINEIDLETYVKNEANERIKKMFLDNLNDTNLREVYFYIRRKELNPINIYSYDYINSLIEEEIDGISNKKSIY